jgi:hypothetical protein
MTARYPGTRYPHSRKSGAGQIVAAILIVIMMIIAAYVVLTLLPKGPGQNPPGLVAWPTDSDGDRYPDNMDAYPNDPLEWADANHNGIGDNSESYAQDNDSDGFNDLVDLHDGFDAGILIELKTASITDQVDLLTGRGNVYFNIHVNGRQESRIDDSGYPYTFNVGTVYRIDKSLRFNVDDNSRFVKISISMIDEDFFSKSDPIDIDGVNLADKTLDIMFDTVNGSWYGDNLNGFADGSLDGTQSSDDDDGALSYDVSVVPISGLKTYAWSYAGDGYEMQLNLSAKQYYLYKYNGVDRSPDNYDDAKAFVTVNDPAVAEAASELASMASARGFSQIERANFVLCFVQSIDYSYDNVSAGQNEYWRYPLETLYDQTGDCEDTSILYAAIMEKIGNDAVLLLLPGHMATGLSCPGASGGHVTFESNDYYYCESTGPGWEVGEVPPEMSNAEVDCVQVP